MALYRVLCKYEPTYRHLAGSGRDAWHFSRGAWRVFETWDVTSVTAPLPVTTWGKRALGVLSLRRPRKGTRVNPRKLLQEYRDAQRAEQRHAADMHSIMFDDFEKSSHA